MTKTTTRSFPMVLKSIITDTAKDTPSFALNDKQVRARLRANEKARTIHAKNTSWVANNAKEYDIIRAGFDNAYAAKLAKPAKAPRKPKAKAPAAAQPEAAVSE